MSSLSDMSAIILAGGLGTRLRSVLSDRPKVLAPVCGRPFLTFLLEQLHDAGIRHVVLSTGYKADMVREAIGTGYRGMSVDYSHEDSPLGTGGGVRLAVNKCRSDLVMVMNGDSFVEADLPGYHKWFTERERKASLLLVEVPDVSRYGRVVTDNDGRVTCFEEKGGASGPGMINAGVYIVRRNVLEDMPEGEPRSLEKDLFPSLCSGGLWGWPGGGSFIDIGTPESLSRAEKFFAG